jgi:cell division septal protein FtsQ
LEKSLSSQSFVLARLPDLSTLKSFDGGLKEVVLERYFPFDLQVQWKRYSTLFVLSLEGKTWEFMENGEFVENPRLMPTVTGSVYVWPLPDAVKSGLATMITRIPDKLKKTINMLNVESSEIIVLQLEDGLKCYLSLANYERHLPYMEIYVNKARKDGKKELHFEYSEVYAK